MNLADLKAYRDKLVKARASDAKTITFGEQSTTFRDDRELAAALADVERRIAELEGRGVRIIRASTSKGL